MVNHMKYDEQVFRRALRNHAITPIPLHLAKRFDITPIVRRSKQFFAECEPEPQTELKPESEAEFQFSFDTTTAPKWKVDTFEEDYSILDDLSPLARQLVETNLGIRPPEDATAEEPTALAPEQKHADIKTYNYTVQTAAQRRAATKEMYDKACTDFLSSRNPEQLRAVLRSVHNVYKDDIDVDQAGEIVKLCERYLDKAKDDRIPALYACQVIVYYQSVFSVGGPLFITTSTVAERAGDVFTDIASVRVSQLGSVVIQQMESTIKLWTKLAHANRIPEHVGYMLIASALQWIFGHVDLFHGIQEKTSTNDALMAHVTRSRVAFRELFAAIYAQNESEEMRAQLRSDFIRYLLRSTVKQDGGIGLVLCEGVEMSPPAALLLDIIMVEGSLPEYKWSESLSVKGRKNLEEEAAKAHDRATAVAGNISRRLIEHVWKSKKSDLSRQQVRSLIEDVAKALPFPEWPSAETFLTSFTANLTQLSSVHRTAMTYPSFLFDMMLVLHDALALVSFSQSDDSRSTKEGTLAFLGEFEKLVKHNKPAAVFLATHQCAFPDSPVREIEELLRNAAFSVPNKYTTKEPQYIRVIQQWPIATFYSRIIADFLNILRRDDLAYGQQAELLRVIDQAVTRDPKTVDVDEMLAKLPTASPAMCDALARIISKALVDCDDPLPVLEGLTQRMDGSGVVSYKKRCISILAEFAETSAETRLLTWRTVLATCLDDDASVRTASAQMLSGLLPNSNEQGICEVLATLQEKSPKLVQHGLKYVLAEMERGPVRALVYTLLDHSLVAAASILSSNGVYMPQSRVPWLFDLATSSETPSQHRVLCFEMLRAALSSVPRLILGRKKSAEMLQGLSKWIRLCTEPEIKPVAEIMWELCHQTSAEDLKLRKSILYKIAQTSYTNLVAQGPEPLEGTRSEMIRTRQMVMMAGCVRFWPRPGTPLSDDEKAQTKKMLFDTTQHLARLALKSKDPHLAKTLVRTAFRVATASPALFVEVPEIADMFKMCTAEHGDMWTLFVEMLIEFLMMQTESPPAEHSDRDRLFGENGVNETEEAVSWLLQSHEQIILDRLTSDIKSEALTAMKLISRGVRYHYIDPIGCMPQVICAIGSPYMPVSELALSTFASVAMRWHQFIVTRIPTGVKLAAEQYRDNAPSGTVTNMLTSLPASRKILREVLRHLVRTIDNCSSDYAVMVVNGLKNFEFTVSDAHYLADEIESFAMLANRASDSVTTEGVAIYSLFLLLALWLRYVYREDEDEPQRAPKQALNPRRLLTLWSSKTVSFARQVFEVLSDAPSDGYTYIDVVDAMNGKVPEAGRFKKLKPSPAPLAT